MPARAVSESHPVVEGDVDARSSEAEVVEDGLEVLRGEAARAGEFDGRIADLGDFVQRAGHVAGGVFADGVELE
jgi:hypothetical protein